MKKTKIVCTLGPASDTKEIISAMAEAGMNVVRLNFSHGTHADHAIKIKTVKEVRTEKKIPLPIMLDTKGPEFRIKTFRDGKATLKGTTPASAFPMPTFAKKCIPAIRYCSTTGLWYCA